MTGDLRQEPAEMEHTEGRGHDVFISYSRVDRASVVSLAEALTVRGKRPWVDLEDIPPSAEWMQEIHSAIDTADGYVVVVSPDFARSTVCSEELLHAVESGKRIVPIVVRPTDPSTVPASLAKLNWIDATVGVVASACDAIVQALDTDLDRVRDHTRLLVRASEWSGSDEDRSSLLRGRELADAEGLIAGGDREPRATQLQTRFVLASRRATGRRQRGAIAVATTVALVAMALGVFAWTQRNAAAEQRDIAQAQTRSSNSRAIAAQALLNLDSKLDVGALLALEAYRTAPTPEALDALHIAAQRSVAIERTLRGHEGSVTTAKFSPDGRMIASGGADGTLAFWDTSNWAPIPRPIVADEDQVSDLAFNVSGTMLATAGRVRGVEVWDPATGNRLLGPLKVGDVGAASVAFSPDGEVIAAGSERGNVSLWRPDSGDLIRILHVGGHGGVSALAYSPADDVLAAGSRQGEVILWDPSTGRRIGSLETGAATLTRIEFSPDGRTLALGIQDRSSASNGDVLIWQREGGKLIRLEGHSDVVEDVAFSPSGRLVASASVDGTVRIWDLRTDDQVGQPLSGPSGGIHSVSFSPDGDSLISGGSEGDVIVWDLQQRSPGEGGAVNIVAFSPDGTSLATAEPFKFGSASVKPVGFGVVDLRDPSTMNVIQTLPMGRVRPYGLAFGPDGSWLAINTTEGMVVQWDVDAGRFTGKKFRAPLFHGDYLNPLAVSPDGRIIAIPSGFGDIFLVDRTSGRAIGPSLSVPIGIGILAFSPDGGELIAGSGDGRLFAWDTKDWSTAGPAIISSLTLVFALAYSPDGSIFVSGGSGGPLSVWDAATHERLRDVDAVEGVVSLAFSPDGSVLAAGTESGSILLFDTATWRQIGEPIQGQRDWVNSVAFSHDGELLAAGSEDGSIVLLDPSAWIEDVGSLRARLCQVAGRSLSETEWEDLIPSEPYHESCGAASADAR